MKQRCDRLGFGLRQAAAEVVEALGFDCGPEGFAQSIVVAVPLAAHALDYGLLFQQQSKALAAVLTAAIRMMNAL